MTTEERLIAFAVTTLRLMEQGSGCDAETLGNIAHAARLAGLAKRDGGSAFERADRVLEYAGEVRS